MKVIFDYATAKTGCWCLTDRKNVAHIIPFGIVFSTDQHTSSSLIDVFLGPVILMIAWRPYCLFWWAYLAALSIWFGVGWSIFGIVNSALSCILPLVVMIWMIWCHKQPLMET